MRVGKSASLYQLSMVHTYSNLWRLAKSLTLMKLCELVCKVKDDLRVKYDGARKRKAKEVKEEQVTRRSKEVLYCFIIPSFVLPDVHKKRIVLTIFIVELQENGGTSWSYDDCPTSSSAKKDETESSSEERRIYRK
ncbi:hypothetical protein Tco_0693221 [Tanacetum coccineum]